MGLSQRELLDVSQYYFLSLSVNFFFDQYIEEIGSSNIRISICGYRYWYFFRSHSLVAQMTYDQIVYIEDYLIV